jgi:myosin-5
MLGALEFGPGDDHLIIQRLVYDIDPIALVHDKKRSPGLAAHVFFMCIRYLDHIQEFERLQLMMETYIKAVDSTVQVLRHTSLVGVGCAAS